MKKLIFPGLLAAACFFGCDKNGVDETENMKKAALQNYAAIVLANYQDATSAMVSLDQKIKEFTANPTDAGFLACKNAWLAARLPYGQSEAFRFYGGPIDGLDGVEGFMNAWPMDENFIDYVDGNPSAGIINNPGQYPEITRQILMGLNESISEESIFTGFHAIEFLLWGQDLSISGAGARPFTDFVSGAGGTAANQDRRGKYLLEISALLLGNLQTVLAEWQADGKYRKKFLDGTETKIALGYIFASLAEFSKGELAGERMFVAVDTKDQENEHSCFSDNTHNDLKMNLLGLQNVYFGKYKRTDGTVVSGQDFHEIVEKADQTKADLVKSSFDDSEKNIHQIPTPFDQAIANQPNKILPAIATLRQLSDRLVDAGKAAGAEF